MLDVIGGCGPGTNLQEHNLKKNPFGINPLTSFVQSDVVCWEAQNKINQLWRWDGKHIISCVDSYRVLDICGASTSAGAKIIIWKPNAGLNQDWELLHPDMELYDSDDELQDFHVSSEDDDDDEFIQ